MTSSLTLPGFDASLDHSDSELGLVLWRWHMPSTIWPILIPPPHTHTHFQGLDEIEAVDIAHEFKDIPIQFLNSWNERSKVNENSLDAQRRKILYDDNQQYSQRLSNIVNKII